MRKGWLFVITFVAALFCAATVLGTDSLSSKNYWSEWQNTEANTGYSTVSSNFPNVSLTTSVPYGSGFQPLIADIDSDGVNEIIGSSGTILKIWTTSSNLITLEDELIVGTQSKSMAVVNTTSGLTILYPTGNFIELIRMNSTGLHIVGTYNITTDNSTSTSFNTGIKCSSLTNPNKCYFQTNTKRIYQYIPQTGNVLTYHSSNLSNTEFAVGDIDNNGMNDIAFGTTVQPTTGKVCLFSTQTGTMTFCKPLINSASANHVEMFNIDGVGFSDIIVSDATTAISYVQAFDVTGTGLWTATLSNHAGGFSTQTTTSIVSSTIGFKHHVRQLCVGTDSSFSVTNKLSCLNASTGAIDWFAPASNYNSYRTSYNLPLIGADLNGDGYSDLVTVSRTYYPYLTTYNYSLGSNTGGYFAYGDISGDAIPEIVSQQSGKTYIAYGGAISGNYNVTIAVRSIDDFAVKIPNAIVDLNGQVKTTNTNGDATFIVASLTGNTINITVSGYNDYKDFGATVYENSIYTTFVLMKKLAPMAVLDDVYNLMWLDNFSNSNGIVPLLSRIGYFSPRTITGDYLIQLLNTDYKVVKGNQSFFPSQGSILLMNASIDAEWAIHKTYLTSEDSMLYFILSIGNGCDYVCDNPNNSNSFYYDFMDITGNSFGVLRVWYNESAPFHPKTVIEYYSSNISYGGYANYDSTRWTKCLEYNTNTNPLFFKIFKTGSQYSLYVKNDTLSGNIFSPMNTGGWDACIIDKSTSVSGVVYYVEFFTKVVNFAGNSLDYVDFFVAADKIGFTCSNTTQATITSVSPISGSPLCYNQTQDYSVTIGNPNNDFFTLKVDCYGNNSWSDWTMFTKSSPFTYPCRYNSVGVYNAKFMLSDLCDFPYSTDNASVVQQVTATSCYMRGEGIPNTGSDYTVPAADLCNQFYYDPASDSWKYDHTRCDALEAGHSGVWNMGSNLFRWSSASLAQWVLANVFYFILLLLLFILIVPVIVSWRKGSGSRR